MARKNTRARAGKAARLNTGKVAGKTDPNSMWGGRYALGPAAIMEKINASIGFDRRLYAQDIAGSMAHAEMLVAQDILTAKDGRAIQRGLGQVKDEIESGKFKFSTKLEDIHFNVEARLTDLIGPAGGRLHTARSRNDQVALDVRLWVRDTIDRLEEMLRDLQAALIDRAEEYAATIMPGFTHLQTAQPITFGHHLLAYVEMVGRDRSRLRDCRARLNESPLGAAALAGSPHPIDRFRTARTLGFDGPMANSLDAVSDRDYVVEFLAAASLTAVHLSRLAEEIVIWCSAPFRFIALSDAFTTGSSIMPQKRNPDAAELTRGKVGRIVGAFVALCTIMKGLPLTYGKDMQEDKEPLFDASDALELCVAAMTGMVRDLKANAERMHAVASADYSVATDLADWLVREVGLPFRQAHHATGALVGMASAKGVDLDRLSLAEMQSVEPRITRAVYRVLTVEASVAARKNFGGTAPANVARAVKEARRRFLGKPGKAAR
jgi:argininosuccinate lyase